MPSTWERLGLTQDEWRECQLAAVEMSVASGASVFPQEVALEFALARSFDEATPTQAALPHSAAVRLPTRVRR